MTIFNFKQTFRDKTENSFSRDFGKVNDAISMTREDMKIDNEIMEVYISSKDIKNVTLSRRTLKESELIIEHFDEFIKKNKEDDKKPGLLDAFLCGWKAEKNNTVDIIRDIA